MNSEAYRLVMFPIAAAALFAIIIALFHGMNAGYSALLGGIVWTVPNLYFAYRVLARGKSQSANQVVWTFYRAEVVKLLLSTVLFVVVVKYLSVHALLVLVAFLLAQVVFWLTIVFYLILRFR